MFSESAVVGIIDSNQLTPDTGQARHAFGGSRCAGPPKFFHAADIADRALARLDKRLATEH
jgi:hypothetical protein